MTTPELPDPAQAHSPDVRRDMALRFLAHAQDELVRGNRLQASEKAWAAVAQQLKAIAEQRGWIHTSHYRLYDIAYYLDREYPEDDLNLVIRLQGMDKGHINFYENDLQEFLVTNIVNRDAPKLADDLEGLRHRPMQSYTIATGDTDNQGVVRRLTGTAYAPTTREHGFINAERLREQQAKWGVPLEDDGYGGTGNPTDV